jgi:hypothetical protein
MFCSCCIFVIIITIIIIILSKLKPLNGNLFFFFSFSSYTNGRCFCLFVYPFKVQNARGSLVVYIRVCVERDNVSMYVCVCGYEIRMMVVYHCKIDRKYTKKESKQRALLIRCLFFNKKKK